MKLIPRIRLRTAFVLFFCAAVGLAAYPHPLSAIEPAIATAMVIGLLQQCRQLWSWRSDNKNICIAFARQFALFWRICVASVIGAGVATALLDRNNLLRLTTEQRVAMQFDVLWPIMPISLTAVLCNSVARWRSELGNGPKRRKRRWLFWLFGAVLALLVIVHGSFIVNLVHEAAAGIEAAIPTQFQRPGIYPNLRQEAFRPFWIATGASASLFLATVLLIRSSRQARSAFQRVAAVAVAIPLLAIPVLFCRWYYFTEFHRISPELAGAGLDATSIDWFVGGTLAFAVITASAYQIARSNNVEETISTDLSLEIDSTSLHESVPLLFLIGLHGLYILAGVVLQIAELGSWFGWRPLMFYVSTLWYPKSLLVLAQAAATLQLCWVRFQRRLQITPWVLRGLSPRLFCQSWAVLALLLVIGIPTLNAFAFIAWLGPFNLRTLHGF